MEQKNNNCKVNIEGSFRTVLRPQENNDKYTGGRYCEPKRDNLKPEDGNNEIDSFSKQVTHSTECDDFRVRIVAPMNSQSHVQDQEETSTSSSAAVLSIHPAIDKQVMSLPVTEIIQMNSTDDDSVSTLESLEKGQRSIFGNYWTSNDDISLCNEFMFPGGESASGCPWSRCLFEQPCPIQSSDRLYFPPQKSRRKRT